MNLTSSKNWKTVRLADVCKSVSDTFDFSDTKEVVFINTGDVTDGKFIHSNYSATKGLPGQAKKKFRKGDILYSEIRPINKHFALVDFDSNDYVASTKLMVLRINENIDLKYLYIWLTSKNILKEMQSIAESRSGTFPQLTFDSISKLEIPAPESLSDQKEIAEMLGCLDDKIELLRRENKTLEGIAQTLFKEWFVDFNFPGATGKMVDSELGEIPDGWQVGKLGEVAEITSGKRPLEISEKQNTDFQYPLLGASSVMGYVKDFLFNKEVFVIGRVGTHGLIQRFSEKIWPSDNTIVLYSKYPEFLYQTLKKINFESLNKGAVQPLITQSDMKAFEVVIPDEIALNLFENTVGKLSLKVKSNDSEIQTLSRLRDNLLNKVFNI